MRDDARAGGNGGSEGAGPDADVGDVHGALVTYVGQLDREIAVASSDADGARERLRLVGGALVTWNALLLEQAAAEAALVAQRSADWRAERDALLGDVLARDELAALSAVHALEDELTRLRSA